MERDWWTKVSRGCHCSSFYTQGAGQSFSAGATFRSRSVRHTKVWSHHGIKKEMKVGVFHGSASESAKHRRVLMSLTPCSLIAGCFFVRARHSSLPWVLIINNRSDRQRTIFHCSNMPEKQNHWHIAKVYTSFMSLKFRGGSRGGWLRNDIFLDNARHEHEHEHERLHSAWSHNHLGAWM